MNKLLFILLLGVTLSCSISDNLELKAYKNYYKQAELLLDTLDNDYQWVDSYDPEYYYDAVKQLKTFQHD